MPMTEGQFDESVTELTQAMVNTLARHLQIRGHQFNVAAFMAECRVNLEEVALGAHFHGADLYPIEVPLKKK